jgi:hypothetical protein
VLRLAVVLLVAALGLAGCKSDNDRILHLRGYDISERDMDLYIRSESLQNLIGWALLCRTLEGLNAQDAGRLLTQLTASSTEPPPPGAIARPGQQPHEASATRWAELIQRRC